MNSEDTSFRIAEMGRLARIVLERTDDDLTICLSLVPRGSSDGIELRFCGVSNLQFLGERTGLTETVLLMADDISSRQWEGVKFRVRDSENEVISFMCREIEGPSARWE
jgi:hypothetical protein